MTIPATIPDPFGARATLGPGLARPLPARCGRRPDRPRDAAGHGQDPAREPAPPRRRRGRPRARMSRRCSPGDPGSVGRGGDPVHAGAGPPPGLHRCPGGRRPRGHARRDGRPRRRPGAASIRSSRPTSSSTTRVQIDRFGTPGAFAFNVEREYDRNGERYQLLRWAQTAFRDLRVVPPGTGIIHQVNLEFLATVVTDRADEAGGRRSAFPDTVVGTDSHTTMVNGLGVLGYGVGGIEAEAVLLGQPLYQPMPHVVGVRLHGALPRGSTATDLVLVVTEMLRAHGVVGSFVEFAGDGLATLALADRTTISNMSPEFGATSTLFPIDDETLTYLRLTGRSPERVDLVERYARTQGLWREPGRRAGLRRAARARPRQRGAVGVPPARAGPARTAAIRTSFPHGLDARSQPCRDGLPRRRRRRGASAAWILGRLTARRWMRQAHRRADRTTARVDDRDGPSRRRSAASRHDPDRLGRDRRDHVVHEHLQPDRDGRRRAAGPQRGRPRAARRPDRQDVARARFARGDRLPRGGRADGPARDARVRAGRLRLHDLHRQLRTARRRGRRPRSRRTTSSSPPSCRATGTSRVGSIRWRGRATSPRRRWSSPSRWPVASTST